MKKECHLREGGDPGPLEPAFVLGLWMPADAPRRWRGHDEGSSCFTRFGNILTKRIRKCAAILALGSKELAKALI